MAQRKSFLLRLPDELLEELNRWAADELRSVNSQIEYLLRDAIQRHRKKLPEVANGPEEGLGDVLINAKTVYSFHGMGNDAYKFVLEYFRDEDAEGYEVVFPALPEIVTWGRTLDEADSNARDALECHLQGLLKDGESLPRD